MGCIIILQSFTPVTRCHLHSLRTRTCQGFYMSQDEYSNEPGVWRQEKQGPNLSHLSLDEWHVSQSLDFLPMRWRQSTFHCWVWHESKWNIRTQFFPGGSNAKESTCDAGDPGLIPRSGRSPGAGNGYPLQCSCLENSMDTGAWQATVDGVARIGHDLATNTFFLILGGSKNGSSVQY